MTEPSVEDIVAEIEAVMNGLPPSQPSPIAGLSDDEKSLILKLAIARGLIASWRAQGKALKARDELIARMWLDAPLPAKEDKS